MASISGRAAQIHSNEPEHAERWRSVMSGLRDRIAPVRAGLMYQVGLLLVAATMLVLPLIYLAMIAAAIFGVFWYAVHAAGIFEASHVRGRAVILMLFLYLAPIVAGGILILFMIKPLFAKREMKTFPLALTRQEQPLLYSFVERLCEVVGAPKPRHIEVDTDVNASARFAGGLWAVVRKDLVLRVGLPLVSGMNLRQLSGILAHEFGHFAQGTGMRVTYVIRSVNAWFARVVYERDEWDHWIRTAGSGDGHWAVTLTLWLARCCVWITRCLLWSLMLIGHGISAFMLRQMEFDADRYEARFAGSDEFESTSKRMATLMVASNAAMSELQASWRERRLCDDLPTLIHVRETEIPREMREKVLKHFNDAGAGWFDTHPSMSQRIAAAKRENAAGVFTVEAAATDLFSNYRELAQRATAAFYQQILGGAVSPENLIPTEKLVGDSGKKRDNVQSLRRYFQDLVDPVRAVFPDRSTTAPATPEQAAETLLELRCKLMDRAADARAAAKAFESADDRLIAVQRVEALISARQKVVAKNFQLNRADDVELKAVRNKAREQKGVVEPLLNDVLRDAMLRLQIALSLEESPKPSSQDVAPAFEVAQVDDYGEYDLADEPAHGPADGIRNALDVLRRNWDAVERLRQHYYVLAELLSRCNAEKNSEALVQDVLARSKHVATELTRIHDGLGGARYPYSHLEKDVTVARYVITAIPPANAVGDVFEFAQAALNAIYALYMRLLSDLAQQAEQIESSLGLPPLPEPEEVEKN